MKNFVARGDVLEFTAGATIVSGQGVLAGTVFGVSTGNVANGAQGTLNLTGVFDLPKVGSQAWTVGQRVYWDAGNARCTTAATGHTLIGTAYAAVGSGAGETTGRVRLNGTVQSRAAHVADASAGSAAEINALRDALIAGGLMASA